jgi:hypothetical protein
MSKDQSRCNSSKDFPCLLARWRLHTSPSSNPEHKLIYQAGPGSAVWTLGNQAICKVHAWKENIQLEAETLAFIHERFPTIPIPEVLFSWIDKSMNRSFLIMKRIHARTLEVA